MSKIDFYRMKDYCEAIKQHFQAYARNEVNTKTCGDIKKQLAEIMNSPAIEEDKFFIEVNELLGGTIRVLQSQFNVKFLNWVGGEETFTKEHFTNTMKTVWPELQ